MKRSLTTLFCILAGLTTGCSTFKDARLVQNPAARPDAPMPMSVGSPRVAPTPPLFAIELKSW